AYCQSRTKASYQTRQPSPLALLLTPLPLPVAFMYDATPQCAGKTQGLESGITCPIAASLEHTRRLGHSKHASYQVAFNYKADWPFTPHLVATLPELVICPHVCAHLGHIFFMRCRVPLAQTTPGTRSALT